MSTRFRDLRAWMGEAERIKGLLRIADQVDWDEELCAITYMVGRQEDAPTLLFENVKGYGKGYSVVTNMPGPSIDRLALALGLPSGLGKTEVIRLLRDKFRTRIPPAEVDKTRAPVNENVMFGEDIDLYQFPAPKTMPLDGGRYLGTCDAVITRNPETGNVNLGTYRNQVLSRNELGFFVSPGKDALLHREKWWDMGKPCEVAIAYGVDPLLYFVGSQSFPKNVSEFEFAGGILGEPYPVVKGEIVDLPIPAFAEIVVEGLSYPDKRKIEGPFSEFPGYYANPEGLQPVIDVKCVHFRNQPILSTALMSDHNSGCALMTSIARSARVWNDLENMGVPGITGVYQHPYAIFALLAVSIEQRYPGHVSQVLSLASQCVGGAYYTKWIIAVDEDVDPTDIHQVLWAMSTRSNPVDDIDILRNTWSTPLDPSQNPAELRPYGSKALINACKDHRHLKTFAKRTAIRKEMYDKIAAKWDGLGLPNKPPEIRYFESGESQPQAE